MSRLVWLPAWLALSYAKLYGAFQDDLFTFQQAVSIIHTGSPKLVLSLLRRKGWLIVFSRERKRRLYRLLTPDYAVDSLASGTSVIPKQGRYSNLVINLTHALRTRYKESLHSVAIFGSVARGTANLSSDMDVLVVAKFHADAASRIDELVEIEYSGRTGKELTWLREHGVQCHISWFPLTPEEAAKFRPLYLDMVEDALITYDKNGLLESILNELRRRLDRDGAKRIWLDEERWYWKLKHDVGEELIVAN